MATALLGGACRERSLPRLVSRRSVRLPELAGGQRPAVAPVAAWRQRREVARRGVEPLLALLGLLVPLALDLVGHVELLEADGQLQRLWLGLGLGLGSGSGLELGAGLGVRIRSWG